MTTWRRSAAVVSVLALTVGSHAAQAHTVTVDGCAADWFNREANPAGAKNVGIIARNASGQGEYIWDDAMGDARTDLSGGMPEIQAEITRVQVTATPQFLALLVQAGVPSPTGIPVQLQIAIDTNRLSGMGTLGLPGFSSTNVSPAAAWERVIRTRLRGAMPAVDVFDPAYALVAPVASNPPRIARGNTGVIEITIPWAMLGLNSPPAALRFTIASFQEAMNGDVVQFAMAPYALDVVSNYGDPRAAGYPNTFAEFSAPSSNVLDYSFDVHFNSTQEVIAPALITRVVSNSSQRAWTPWIEVTGVSAVALATNSLKVSNAVVIDGPEGTLLLPNIGGGTLLSADVLRLAQNGRYLLGYQFVASAEWTANSDTIPDMTPYSFWSSGTGLSTGTGPGTLLLLDGSDTVIDVVNWGGATFTGVTAFPGSPFFDSSLLRMGTTDTDNCATDFTLISASANIDAGVVDSGTSDTGMPDIGTSDTGTSTDVLVAADTLSADVGILFDAGTSDMGVSDVPRCDVVTSDAGAELGPKPVGCGCSTPGNTSGRSASTVALFALGVGLLFRRGSRRGA